MADRVSRCDFMSAADVEQYYWILHAEWLVCCSAKEAVVLQTG